MLRRVLPIILLASALLLGACGAAAPTQVAVSPEDIQNTAVAAAQTIVAATELAKPTETPLPPTEAPSPTPLPTFTPDPLLVPPTSEFPTLEVPTLVEVPTLFVPSPTAAADLGDCLKRPLNTNETPQSVIKRIRVENELKYGATVSFNMSTPNPYGQCGVLAVVVKKGQKVIISVPPGSYYVGAYTEKPPQPNGISIYLGPSKTDDLLRLIVKSDRLNFVGP